MQSYSVSILLHRMAFASCCTIIRTSHDQQPTNRISRHSYWYCCQTTSCLHRSSYSCFQRSSLCCLGSSCQCNALCSLSAYAKLQSSYSFLGRWPSTSESIPKGLEHECRKGFLSLAGFASSCKASRIIDNNSTISILIACIQFHCCAAVKAIDTFGSCKVRKCQLLSSEASVDSSMQSALLIFFCISINSVIFMSTTNDI